MKRFKQLTLLLLAISFSIGAYKSIEGRVLMSLCVAGIMIVGIIISAVWLEEEPLEFFNNFSNIKEAKVSALLFTGLAVSIISAIVFFLKGL